MSVRAAVYCRISDDRRGLGLGVERQREDCAALVISRGWSTVRTLTDNDVSAYSGKARPGYRHLLGMLAAGQVDAVVAWHPDRLHRSPSELEEFITLVERHGVRVETVQAGEWDLSTPSGRLVARQLGSVARYESENKAERVRRALQQNAAGGRAHGRVAYGWTRTFDPATGQGRDIVEKSEAKIVNEIADRIVAGDSIRSIAADLNARLVLSPTGKPWGKQMLRHVVTRERNVALRVHRGVVIGDADWEPILERGLWEQVRTVLADPARRTSAGSTARHLLSGIARCGVCGGPVRASQNRQTPSYKCAERSCVSRNRDDVDAYVTAVILGRLARPDAAALLAPDRTPERVEAVDRAQGLRARLDRAADDYADDKIDARQLERITARLRPELDAAETQLHTIDNSTVLDGLVANDDAALAWESLSISRRRAVVALLAEVTIERTKPGTRIFDPGSVRIGWRP